MNSKRIVYTLAVGKPKFAQVALGLGRSLRLIGDPTWRVVVTDQPDFPWSPAFDEVLPWEGKRSPYFAKLSGLERTDADQVLFIDADCLVFRPLAAIFEYCAGKGLCVQGYLASEGEWYGDVSAHCRRHQIAALPRFNGGMIYYERGAAAERVIATTYELALKADLLGFDNPRVGEEPILALAMAQTGLGHLCPPLMDFMSAGRGIVGPLRLNVLTNTCDFVCRAETTRFIRPHIFHGWRYLNFRIYWKQLKALQSLEHYEQTHEAGHISTQHRLQRSVERRLLKLSGRL